jgi:hypothetical protein
MLVQGYTRHIKTAERSRIGRTGAMVETSATDQDTNAKIATVVVIAAAAAAATDMVKSVTLGQEITIPRRDLVGCSEATEVGVGAGALIEIAIDGMGGMASLRAEVVKEITREPGTDGESAAGIATGHPKTIECEIPKMAVSAEPAHDMISKRSQSQSPLLCTGSLERLFGFSTYCHVLCNLGLTWV